MDAKQKAKVNRLMARLESAVMGEYNARSTGERIPEAKLELRNARMAVRAFCEHLAGVSEWNGREYEQTQKAK